LWSESFEVWTLHPPIAPHSLAPTIQGKLSESGPDGKRKLSIMGINYLYFYTSATVDCKNRSEKPDKETIKRITRVLHDVSGLDFSRYGKKKYNMRASAEAGKPMIRFEFEQASG
jgi:hypothetical protein